jgi:hypothetical protein
VQQQIPPPSGTFNTLLSSSPITDAIEQMQRTVESYNSSMEVIKRTFESYNSSMEAIKRPFESYNNLFKGLQIPEYSSLFKGVQPPEYNSLSRRTQANGSISRKDIGFYRTYYAKSRIEMPC